MPPVISYTQTIAERITRHPHRKPSKLLIKRTIGLLMALDELLPWAEFKAEAKQKRGKDGYSLITITWEDGPPFCEVEAIADEWERKDPTQKTFIILQQTFSPAALAYPA